MWDEIHDIERTELRDFFDGSSFTRTPKVYREYRDFIINKYREEPTRQLTFTDVRKSLVGDISLLHKVFKFLEKWGLINFSANLGNSSNVSSSSSSSLVVVEDEEDKARVKVEGTIPNAVRVGASPNSPKPISAPPVVGDSSGDAVESGFKLPPLASYSDVFGDLVKQKGLVCGNCGGNCDSGHYKYTKVISCALVSFCSRLLVFLPFLDIYICVCVCEFMITLVGGVKWGFQYLQLAYITIYFMLYIFVSCAF